jgi:hypothetical protein
VHFLGKVLGEEALVSYTHFLSKRDFREFIGALSKVISRGFLQDYNYVFIDLDKRARETVRHEFFNNGVWAYEHDRHMRSLQDVYDKSAETERTRTHADLHHPDWAL